MSSRDEKKARALKRMGKREKRKSLSNKRKRNDDDDSDSGEDERLGKAAFLPTPKQLNEIQNKPRNGKAAQVKKKYKKDDKSVKSERFSLREAASNAEYSDHTLKLNYWLGDPGEDPPSDELKTLRKSIGVNVRGNLSLCPTPIMTVPCAGLPAEIETAIRSLNFKALSSVQQQCIPAILSGSSILGLAPTGSGKTYAYGLPMIPHIIHHSKMTKTSGVPSPIGLVLVPTRELAIQVAAAFKLFHRLFSIRTIALYGGQEKETQVELASEGILHAVVATPGRLIDLIRTKNISLQRTSYLVLDEADSLNSWISLATRLDPIDKDCFSRPRFPAVLEMQHQPGSRMPP
jgi:hypothetical protein